MHRKKVIKAEILSNKKIAKDHYRIRVRSKHLAENSIPGQFVLVKVQDKTYDPLLRIPLGVHKIKKDGIELLYKVVGTATTLLSLKREGETLDVLGSLGNGFRISNNSKRAIIVSGGHGVAPLYSLAEVLIKKGRRIDFFVGARTKSHVVCSNELKKLGAKIHVATEDGTLGYKGYVTELVEKHIKHYPLNAKRYTLYACGPRGMAKVLARVSRKHKISMQVSLDEYMACGTGACLGCAVGTKTGYKLVCKDGPVFDAEEIVWG